MVSSGWSELSQSHWGASHWVGFSSWWSLIRVVSHQGGLIRVTFQGGLIGWSHQSDLSGWSHHGGLSSGWSPQGDISGWSHWGGLIRVTFQGGLIRVAFHRGGLPSGWPLSRMASHHGGLSSRCCYQDGLSSGSSLIRWSFIRIISSGGLSSGSSLIRWSFIRIISQPGGLVRVVSHQVVFDQEFHRTIFIGECCR